jgi:membrane peptidoglycan carboxypeptidase
MVGYTPELSAAVWLGHERPAPLRDKTGRPIEGHDHPASIWRGFLNGALAGAPIATLFPEPARASFHLARWSSDFGGIGE